MASPEKLEELNPLTRILWGPHRFRIASKQDRRYTLECSDGTGLQRELEQADIQRFIDCKEIVLEEGCFNPDGSIAKPGDPVKLLATFPMRKQTIALVDLTWCQALDADYRAGKVKLYAAPKSKKDLLGMLAAGAVTLDVWIKLRSDEVRELCRQIMVVRSPKVAKEERKNIPTNDLGRPKVSSLKRKYAMFRAPGFHVEQFVPRTDRCTEGGKRLDPVVLATCEEVILKLYATPGRMSVAQLRRSISAKLTADAGGTHEVRAPCPATLGRIIAGMDDARMIGARFGLKKMRELKAMRSEGPRYTRVGEMVFMDCWKVDIVVLLQRTGIWMKLTAAQRKEWGVRRRVFMCVAIDAATRMVLAIGFALAETPELTRRVLRMALGSKEEFATFTGCEAPPPPAFGFDALGVDSGIAFRHGWFAVAALSAIGNVKIGIVGQPWRHGIKERLFRTGKDQLLPYFSGLTQGNSVARGEYDAMANASAFLEGLGNRSFRFFNDVYHLQSHRGLKKQPPINRMAEELNSTGAKDAKTSDELRVSFGIDLELPLTPDGLTFNNVRYQSVWLRQLFSSRGKMVLQVKIDPVDLGRISVLWDRHWQTVPGPIELQGVGLTRLLRTYRSIASKHGQQASVNFPIVAKALLHLAEQGERDRIEAQLIDMGYNSQEVIRAAKNLELKVIYRPAPGAAVKPLAISKGAFGEGFPTAGLEQNIDTDVLLAPTLEADDVPQPGHPFADDAEDRTDRVPRARSVDNTEADTPATRPVVVMGSLEELRASRKKGKK